MADYDLIAQYVDELGTALRGRVRNADRVCAEIEDHLTSTADQMHGAGLSQGDAARRAIKCFGPVDELASSFLTLEQEGAGARATRFTTRAGLSGAIGGLLLALPAAFQVARDSGSEPRGAAEVVGGIALILAIVLMATGLVGIILRHRGTFRRIDRIALGLLAVGLITMWLPFWGILAIASPLMVIGTIGFGVRVYRVHALPRPPLAFMLLAGAVLLALTYMKSDKASVEFGAGWVFVIAGWCWLQFTLWSERPERRRASA